MTVAKTVEHPDLIIIGIYRSPSVEKHRLHLDKLALFMLIAIRYS